MRTYPNHLQKVRRCGECAGIHQTRECPMKPVPCCNCGKDQGSWQKGAFQNFTAYKVSVQRARCYLMKSTAGFMKGQFLPPPSTPTTVRAKDDQGFTLVSHQKPEVLKRGPGRPRKQLQVNPPPQVFGPSGSSSRPQSSLFSTRGRGKDGDAQ